MLSNLAGWILGFTSIAVVWGFLLIRKGPALAIGPALVLSFAFPVWVKIDLAGMPFTVRTAIACLVMLGFAVHPRGKILSPLTLLDLAIGLMCLTHIASDSYVSGFTPLLPLRAYGEWVLPYVAGRYALRDRHDLRYIAPWVIGVLFVMGLAAIVESLTKTNPFEVVFGNRPEELANRSAQRLGFKRAFGMATHPIYFGVLIAVLMPWLTCFWQNYRTHRDRTIVLLAGLLAFVGTLCTVSRTPVLCVLLTVALLFVLKFRFLRWPLGFTALIAVVTFCLFPNEILDKVSNWTGGGDKLRLIEVDGKAVAYSGVRSRLIVFQAYSGAIGKSGLLGYGSNAVSTFPPQIPYMQGKAEVSNMMKLVDNGYILITLRFGWLGGGCLLLLFVTTIFTGALLYADRPTQMFPLAVSSLVMVLAGIAMFLVWMSYDFAFPLLWTMGILSGLAATREQHRSMRSSVLR